MFAAPAIIVPPLYLATCADGPSLLFIATGSEIPTSALPVSNTEQLETALANGAALHGGNAIAIHVFSSARDARFFDAGAEWADPGFTGARYTDPGTGATFLALVIRDADDDEVTLTDHRGDTVALEMTRLDADLAVGWLGASASHIEHAHNANPTWDEDPASTAEGVSALRALRDKHAGTLEA